MTDGYIKLFRKIEEWEWYRNIPTKCLFWHILIKANYEERTWRGVTVRVGEFITSLPKLAHETGLTIQQTRTALRNLQSTKEITYTSTKTFTHIKLQNWQEYQQSSTKKSTGKQQEDNSQLITEITTTKEDKKKEYIETYKCEGEQEKKKTPKEIAEEFFATDPEDIVSSLSPETEHREFVLREIRKFISYWTEPNKSGTKLRWQLEDTFEITRRLRNWFDRSSQNGFKFNSYQKSHATFD